MNEGHLEAAIKLWEKCDEIEPTIGDSQKSLKKYLRRNPGMSFICIEKKTGHLVGTILAGHDCRRGYIYHLAVEPEHRNNSIGNKLLELSQNELILNGIERCIVMVKKKNEKGSSFWERNSWQKRDDLIMYSKNPEIL